MKFEEMFGAETPATLTKDSGAGDAALSSRSGTAGTAPDVIPGQLTVEECIAEGGSSSSLTPGAGDATQGAKDGEPGTPSDSPPPEFVTETTPSGLEIYYSWAPRRHYKIRRLYSDDELAAMDSLSPEWVEVPSVTTVLGVLDRSGPLVWWAQKQAIEGVLALVDRGEITGAWLEEYGGSADEIVDLLTEHKLTVNHRRDEAADRGVNVHGALENWCEAGIFPHPYGAPEHEQGYLVGLGSFLRTVQDQVGEIAAEVMVGSLEHQYAGRYDLRLTLEKPVEVVTKAYPKRADRVEEIPAGRYLLDLKTRKKAAVYNTNYLQLEAYERASVECGYEPTDYRGVIVVTEGGQYQLSINQDWTFDDFAQVRGTYQVLHEREILRELREELGAKEAA